MGKTSESMTRLCFFIIVVFLVMWESFAVYTKTVVPHIEAILTFAAGILINKQYQERKADPSPPQGGTP